MVTGLNGLEQMECVQGGSSKRLTTGMIYSQTSPVIQVNFTVVTGGTSGRLLYDNAGTIGELPVGTGVSTALGQAVIGSGGIALISSRGTVVINGVTPVTVANTNVTANSLIVFTLKTVGGTVGAIPRPATITPGTGFTVIGTALDSSTYNYGIIG